MEAQGGKAPLEMPPSSRIRKNPEGRGTTASKRIKARVRASTLPDSGGARGNSRPYRDCYLLQCMSPQLKRSSTARMQRLVRSWRKLTLHRSQGCDGPQALLDL
jgi:hypothetical protein